MKIAIFLYGLTGGGATRRVVSLAKGFAAEGHQVELVVIEARGPLKEEVRQAAIGLVELPVSFPWSYGKRRLKIKGALRGLASYLKDPPDVFLSGANHAHLTALRAWLRAGQRCPLILRLSNHLSGSLRWESSFKKRILGLLKRREIKKLYPEASFWLAVSRSILEDALSFMAYPREKTRVVYNPIPVEEIREKAKAEPPHPWFREKGPPVILGAGRLSPQKDFETLLRAFALARQKRKDLRLLILGEGKERKKLLSLAARLKVSHAFSLPGFTNNPWCYMARADLFVLSSRYEGLPGVLLEAMALGCPVVSTDCWGGCGEVLAGGRFGPLVPVGDHVALARAILEVLEKPPSASLLKARAEEFSLSRAVKGYLSVFAQVLHGNQN